MKTVLSIAAAIFILLGIAVGVVSQMDYGTVLIGLNLDLAATLIIGGFVVMGLAGVIGAVNKVSLSTKGASRVSTTREEAPSMSAPSNDGPRPPRMGGITAGAAGAAGMGAAAAGAAGAAAGTLSTQMDKAGKGVDSAIDKVAEVAAEAKDKASDVVKATTETVTQKAGDVADKASDSVDNLFASAKDAAKDKAESAVEAVKETASDAGDAISDTAKGAVDAVVDKADDAKEAAEKAVDAVTDAPAEETPAEDTPTEDTPEAENAEEDPDQLYVVEELLIRDRPARVLSDNTVEAETDEGWMRFENVEHLEEYLDAMKG